LVLPAKPAIAVGGDQIIDPVTNEWRDDYEYIKSGPQTGEPAGDFEGCPALLINLAVVQQYDAVELLRIKAMGNQLFPGKFRLKCGKTKKLPWVPADNEQY